MTLRSAPLLYVFYEAAQLVRERQAFEQVLGLPVIEVEPHMPHHRHGVVKYDAGSLILSLNLTSWSKFRRDASDALVTVLAIDPDRLESGLLRRDDDFLTLEGDGRCRDRHGHHFAFRPRPGSAPIVDELRLTVADLDASIRFYRDVLDLELVGRSGREARFAAGRLDLVLERGDRAVDGRLPCRSTYLPVFYTADITATHAALMARGVPFKRPCPGFSEIGGSSRFQDPAGHTLCLYEPSAACLTWGSGPKVIELSGLGGGATCSQIPGSSTCSSTSTI